MDFDVYCDESRPELLHSDKDKAKGDFLVIGSLWLPTELRNECKAAIHELRNRHGVGGEFKWNKVSPSRYAFYEDIVDWFFTKGDAIRYRAIVVERKKLNLIHFHNGDGELGFYKFYYQLIFHKLADCNKYQVFCDHKVNAIPTRIHTLGRCLSSANKLSEVTVQAIPSDESVLIQLCDVLTGLTQARFNGPENLGHTKRRLLDHAESKITHPIQATWRSESKFNVFQIRLEGGW